MSLPEGKKLPLVPYVHDSEEFLGYDNISFSVGAPISDNGMSTGFFLTEKGPEDGAHPISF